STGIPETFEIDFKPLRMWLKVSVFSPEKGYFVAVFENITERKQAEDAIRKSGQEWQTTFDSITDIVFLLDDEGRIIRHNRAFEIFTGKTAPDIDGRYCFEVLH